MAQIKKSYLIDAPITDVWHALTDADAIERWGAGPVDMKPLRGHAFSLWGGDIYGTVVDVEPPHRLVEEWFGGPWDVPSVAVFTLSEDSGAPASSSTTRAFPRIKPTSSRRAGTSTTLAR